MGTCLVVNRGTTMVFVGRPNLYFDAYTGEGKWYGCGNIVAKDRGDPRCYFLLLPSPKAVLGDGSGSFLPLSAPDLKYVAERRDSGKKDDLLDIDVLLRFVAVDAESNQLNVRLAKFVGNSARK